MTALPHSAHRLALALVLASCGSGGGGGNPISPRGQTPELVFCRSRIVNPHNQTEIDQATRFGLARRKILNRTGIETGVRVSPDGRRIAFARERQFEDPDSREIYVATIDGSAPEVRLTADRTLDDSPSWSPDGSRIAFSSNRLGAGRRLFVMDAEDGSAVSPLYDDGSEQRDPDWSRASGEIAFARIDPAELRSKLYSIDPDGGAPVPLTDGGTGVAVDAVPGDHEPAFSPDGERIVFSRVVSDGVRVLMLLDVATSAVTPLTQGDVVDRFPRWSPHADLLLFARDRERAGMPGLRLHSAGPDGGEPRLVFPDERFDYLGFDPLPGMAAAAGDRAVAEWTDVDLATATLGVTIGRRLSGEDEAILARDGDVIVVETREFDNRDVAGLRVSVQLPAADALDVLAIEVSVTAAVDPVDQDTTLRLAVANLVENRNDTVLETIPQDTRLVDHAFTLGSLAHVTRGREFQIDVISEMRKETFAQLSIDEVRIRIKKRPPPRDSN